MNDHAQFESASLLSDNMHVIRHDYPREQAVACIIEVQQAVLDKLGNPRFPEPASAMRIVKKGIDHFNAPVIGWIRVLLLDFVPDCLGQ